MEFNRALARRLDPVLKSHLAKLFRVVVVVVNAGQRAVLREVVVRRIPHLRDRIIGITDAAVDLVLIVFPETSVCLPAEFARRIVNARCDSITEVRREVVTDLVDKTIDDLVHPTNWLKKRRLPFVFKRLVETMAPEIRIRQLVQRQLWSSFARLVDRDLAAVAGRTRVGVVTLQIAEVLQQRK